jgi:hypothetical protein
MWQKGCCTIITSDPAALVLKKEKKRKEIKTELKEKAVIRYS